MWTLKSVTFLVPQDILNRGSLTKVTYGMEGIRVVESDEVMKPGYFVESTDLRVKSRLWVPVFSCAGVRYDWEEDSELPEPQIDDA